MKKLLYLLLTLIMAFTFVACAPLGGGSGSDKDDPAQGPVGGDETDPKDDPDDIELPEVQFSDAFSDRVTAENNNFYKKYSAEEKELYYLLWQDATKINVKIDISEGELFKIDEAYRDYKATGNSTKIDTYRKCNLTVTVNGTDYYFEEAGIRMRGNTSKREFCDENGEIYDFVHFRFSLNETFDGEEYAEGAWGHDIANTWADSASRKKRDNRTFATMKKFYYKWNKNYDNTYLREVYANRMFRAHGVLAPHITLTQVQLRQKGGFENLGVAALYETVDKQFIKRNFPTDNGGDLYKCTYTTSPANLASKESYGVETPTQRFNYSLKTNDDRTAPDYNHHKYLLALIDALKGSASDAAFRSQLEKLVDMDYFTSFEAVNYLLGNPDCIRNNSNNYYLYFVPESGKAYFIPYDYDRCLGINVDWNPTGNGMTELTPFTTSSATGKVSNPLYLKTILNGGNSGDQALFKSKLQAVLKGDWFTYAHFKAIFETYKATYASLAMPSQTIRTQCGEKIHMARLEFSERGTTNVGDTDDNITVERYMALKRAVALGAM